MAHLDHSDETERKQSWGTGLVQLIFVILIVGAAIAMSSALKSSNVTGIPDADSFEGASLTSVRIMQPDVAAYSPILRLNATVQAQAEVSVTPQVGGEISQVSAKFRTGNTLQKGDILFEIERADFILAVERAEAEIAAASSDLALLEAEADLARQEWDELYPGREISDLAARVPQINAAKARLGSANANKRTAQLSLQRTRVRTPFDARVMASALDIGQVISPGQVVGRLVALDSIELVAPVSLSQLSSVDPAIGRPANYARRGDTEPLGVAEIVRIDAALDARTRLSNLYLTPETEAGLQIGDFVDITIQAEEVSNAVSIPASALVSQDKVWVVESGRLSLRSIVRLGEKDGGDIVVTQPFDTGEGLVLVPPLDAEEGQIIEARVDDRVTQTASAGGGNAGAQ